MENEGDDDTNSNLWTLKNPQKFGKIDLEIKGLVETMQTKALWKSARILRRFLQTCGDLVPSKIQFKTIS